MTADILDLQAFRQKRKTEECIMTLSEAGLSSTDLAWMGCAAARAFSKTIPALDDAQAMTLECLKYLKVGVTPKDDGTIYSVGKSDYPVIHLFVADAPVDYEWDNSGFEVFSLEGLAEEDQGRHCVNKIMDIFDGLQIDALSLYGFFALDCFYFSCIAPKLVPLRIMHHPDNKQVVLALFDSEREAEIVLISNLETWLPDEADRAHTPKEITPA